MTKIVTFGVFDLLHYGHILLFKRCKKIGDYLTVAVQTDDEVILNKPNCNLIFNENDRVDFVKNIRFVDKVIKYKQIDKSLPEIDFDILVIGPDQTNDHFKNAIEYAKSKGKKIIVLERTENISSSQLRTSKHTRPY